MLAIFVKIVSRSMLKKLVLLQILEVLVGIFSGAALFFFIPLIQCILYGGTAFGFGLWQWIALLALLALLSSLLGAIYTDRSYRLSLAIFKDLYLALGQRVVDLPIGAFDSSDPGKYSRMVTQEMTNLGQFIAHFMGIVVHGASAMIALVVCTLIWNVQIGTIFLVATPLCLLVNFCGSKIYRIPDKQCMVAENNLAAKIVEMTRCQSMMRAYNVGLDAPSYQEAFKQTKQSRNKALLYEIISLFFQGSAANNLPVVVAFIAVDMWAGASLSPLDTFVVCALSLRLFYLLQSLMTGGMGLSAGAKQLVAINEVLSQKPMVYPESSRELASVGEAAADHLDFSYVEGHPILRDVTFTAAPNQMIAIVGPSGAGKTTLARLLARFWDTSSGTARIGGTDVRDVTLQDLMGQLSMVFQDVYLFNESIRENIYLGCPEATPDDFKHACVLSGVQEILDRLPEGEDTLVGEGGRALSGGERQRVSIARALLKRANVVLFDEATSALDAENELHIIAAMEELRRRSTLVVIAHKLETIQKADAIVVLNHAGQVAEMGTHKELIAQQGAYYDFWQARLNAKGWRLRSQ